MMGADGRNLGDALRGSRLGFRWVPKLERYLRVRDVDDGFAFDLATPAGIRAMVRPTPAEHRVWWDGAPDAAFIVAAIVPYAAGLAASYATIVLDENGDRVA